MKLISLTIARNSSWCIRATITNALKYCDAAVVVLHNSIDDTLKMLRQFDNRVTIAKLADPNWDEMHHRQQSLQIGRDLGGTHFVVLDDDEILTESMVPRMRELAENCPDAVCIHLPLLSCWRSLDQYRSDPGSPFSNAYKTSLFRDDPMAGWKTRDGYQHHHTSPYNTTMLRRFNASEGGYMHIQHANWRRLVAKQTWYMCMELCRWGRIQANYKGTMDERGLQTTPIPQHWWGEERQYIHLEQEPWHIAEIKRMVRERGVEFFTKHGVEVQQYV
jgi:hypothetical protein